METTTAPKICSRTPAVLRDGLCWPLARIAMAIIAAENDALSEHDLNMRTFAILAMVTETSTRSQLDIARTLGLDKSTLVAAIDDLEARGLVVRRPDPEDRRARIVESTPAGLAAYKEAAKTVQRTEQNIVAGISHEEAQRIRTGLMALIEGGPLREYVLATGSCV
jgi:DNA-binding MarR family transcriptional regulator